MGNENQVSAQGIQLPANGSAMYESSHCNASLASTPSAAGLTIAAVVLGPSLPKRAY